MGSEVQGATAGFAGTAEGEGPEDRVWCVGVSVCMLACCTAKADNWWGPKEGLFVLGGSSGNQP